MNTELRWPPLVLSEWQDTYDTLHMWTQMVGKVCLAYTPKQNHYWNIAFHLTPIGLTTPTLNLGERSLAMTFDFVDHLLRFEVSDGREVTLPLEPQTVAEFYSRFQDRLHRLDISPKIWPMPVEFEHPIPFKQDTTHRSYDRAHVEAYWQACLSMQPVFEEFRCGFLGKCSPLHFFWGGFDLALTRFSGRRAPDRPDADEVQRESYSHEVISHGFWPGGGFIPEAAFYAYSSPEPAGFSSAKVKPKAAFYDAKGFKEFILPYEAVRTSPTPEADLRAFFDTTYSAAADLAGWNRADLERAVPA